MLDDMTHWYYHSVNQIRNLIMSKTPSKFSHKEMVLLQIADMFNI